MTTIDAMAFDLPSSKNLSIRKTVEGFIPTGLYWRLLESDSHDVILGTRGSGKTMLLRMMSIQHLIPFASRDERADHALRKLMRYGIYLPMGIDWCVAYQHEHPNATRFFTDGVNLVAAEAFVEALECVLEMTPDSTDGLERHLSESLSAQWFTDSPKKIFSLASLRLSLLQQQAVLRDMWLSGFHELARSSKYCFRAATIFAPIREAASISNLVLGLPRDHRWLLCLDELENLSRTQLKAILTLIRGSADNLVLKLTTQPYTLPSDTTGFADGAAAVDFRDFEINRLQYDPEDLEYIDLVSGILNNRVRGAGPRDTRIGVRIFGSTTFASRASEVDPGFSHLKEEILSKGNPDSERKKVPLAALRSLRRSATGHRNSAAYSGWRTMVRITDGNPGIFVRLLNELGVSEGVETISPEDQHKVVVRLAESWVEWAYALYPDGERLHRLLVDLGTTLSRRLHAGRDPSDVPVEVNRVRLDLSELDPADAEAFRVGARHALLVAESKGSSTRYPSAEGVWRLSYSIAPKFWLLPRRGVVGTLQGVGAKMSVRQMKLDLTDRLPVEREDRGGERDRVVEEEF